MFGPDTWQNWVWLIAAAFALGFGWVAGSWVASKLTLAIEYILKPKS